MLCIADIKSVYHVCGQRGSQRTLYGVAVQLDARFLMRMAVYRMAGMDGVGTVGGAGVQDD